jgi:hypothetical protein
MTPKKRFASALEFDEWLDQIASDRFNRRVVFQHGNWTALYDAAMEAFTDVADGAPVTLPEWVARGLIEKALPRAMKSLQPARTSKLQAGRPRKRWDAKQWRGDMIDWWRFRQVWYRRIGAEESKQKGPREQRADRIGYRRSQQQRGSNHAIDMWTPYPWSSTKDDDLNVFEAVAEVSHGTPYGGSPDQIRKSYERVNGALKRLEAWRFYESKWLRHSEGQLLTSEMDLAK